MSKVICTVCGREIDSRGMSGHMKTHKAEPEGDDTGGVISYPIPSDFNPHTSQGIMVKDGKATTIHEKKPVKKPAASKPVSSTASKPDPRGQRRTETEHKEEWQGFFRG